MNNVKQAPNKKPTCKVVVVIFYLMNFTILSREVQGLIGWRQNWDIESC